MALLSLIAFVISQNIIVRSFAWAFPHTTHWVALLGGLWYALFMSTIVKLTSAQEAWLEAQVAEGRLPSVDDAVRSAVADMMTISNDDLAWAKPYVDEARASVARGDVSTGEAVLARLRQRIALLKSA